MLHRVFSADRQVNRRMGVVCLWAYKDIIKQVTSRYRLRYGLPVFC